MADNKDELICPACKNKMKKFFIKTANISLDICIDGCGGIFFDNQEIKKFDEHNENIDEILEILSNKTYQPVNENQKRTCPYCESIMVKHGTSVKQLVEIDECYTCGGIFLDYKELETMRNTACFFIAIHYINLSRNF